MKASELMLNDWVRYKESKYPFQVIGITNMNMILPSCGGTYQLNSFEPIPLTKEIMIKNDFNLNKEFQEWWKDGCQFNIMLGCDFDGECAWVSSEINQTTPLLLIKHVHVLQHALHLCGINDLADNFKVE